MANLESRRHVLFKRCFCLLRETYSEKLCRETCPENLHKEIALQDEAASVQRSAVVFAMLVYLACNLVDSAFGPLAF